MLNKSSLFWKIFLAFWLANFFAIAASSYFTLHAKHGNESKQHKQEIVDLIGKHMISSWERDQSFHLPRRMKRKGFGPGIKIIDDNNETIFDNVEGRLDVDHEAFNFLSSSGKNYTIYLSRHKPPRFLQKKFEHMLMLRLLIIFIVSGLVSYALSQFITRPLKRLGEQTQAISHGKLGSTVDADLLSRKDEIGELARDFDKTLINISALIDSKQSLLHDVSHELRAPLARLMAAAGLMEGKDQTDPAMLERIEAECMTMNSLIDQILHLSRFDQSDAKKKSINIVTLIKGCINDTKFEYPDFPISLDTDTSEINLNADETMLAMAINNILRNACQHTAADTTVAVNVHQNEDNVFIAIEDNGYGLPQQELGNIFRPFYRGLSSAANANANADSNSNANFGLGLNISQRAIQKHQGSISVANKQDGGLIFSIKLPR